MSTRKRKAESEAPASSPAPAAVGGKERFEVVEVHRSEITAAPYNPRQLTDDARERLRKGIEAHGMLAPITWNSKTGRVVGGHQRLKVLDAMNGSPDYRLKVARVEMTEKEEIEANILLNAEAAQGEWDLELLKPLLTDPLVRLDATGFDAVDVRSLFSDDGLAERDGGEIERLGDRLAEARDRQAEIETAAAESDTSNFYLVLVFRNNDAREKFAQWLGVRAEMRGGDGNNGRFVDGERIRGLIDAARAGAAATAPASSEPEPPKV